MKSFQTFLIVAALAACAPDQASSPQVEGKMARVTRVVDGDTVVLEDGQRLRYIGVDTPEEFDRRKPVQCFAKEAAEANRRLVEGKLIAYTHDVHERDRYGRLLGYVWLLDGRQGTMGTFVNEKLIRDGDAFAWAYGKDTSKSELFAAAEADAKAHHRGLWSACTVNETKSGREQTEPATK